MTRPSRPGDVLKRIRVVLDRPSHPGNVGAAARAMKTMGLTRLALVAPKRFPDPEANALAAGAYDLLQRAAVYATLREALSGAALAVAFSARGREISHAPLDARAAAAEALSVAQADEVSLVFGSESVGLANEQVMLCNRLAYIPTGPEGSSLNLAAAVQVVAYEIRMALSAPALAQDESRLATIEQLERFYGHLERSLRSTGFLDPGKPKRLMERLRRLFGRARLEREEVNVLRGMLNAWDQKIGEPDKSRANY